MSRPLKPRAPVTPSTSVHDTEAPLTRANLKLLRLASEAEDQAAKLRKLGRVAEALIALRKGRDLIAAAQADQQLRTERRDNAEQLAQAQRQARLRGEAIIEERGTVIAEVEVEGGFVVRRAQASVRRRILGRDGLDTLLKAEAIGRAEYAAGMRYRELYEATDPERALRAVNWSHVGGAGPKADPFAEKRARLQKKIETLEIKVRAGDPSCAGALGASPAERLGRRLMALREVAGKGRSVRAAFGAGRASETYRNALIEALTVAAQHFNTG